MTSNDPKKVAISTIGQAHLFDVAQELYKRDLISLLLTAYPTSQLNRKGLANIPAETYSVPFLLTKALMRILPSRRVSLFLEPFHKSLFDQWASKRLREVDLVIASSGCGLKTGLRAKEQGTFWICDRASSHISYQSHLLAEEYKRYGKPWPGISSKVIETELKEYDNADLIVVPSSFSFNSFVNEGISPDKLLKLSFGTNLKLFYSTGPPDKDTFQVIFAGQKSLRKGIGYLVEAFKQLKHRKKRLILVGPDHAELKLMLKDHDPNIILLPAVNRDRLRQLFSESHVMVLPSIEEGMALVMAEAMACGCPVIASENTGARDLFTDSLEGFCVPIRDINAIAQRLQQLADDPDLRSRMSSACMVRIKSMGGWNVYLDNLLAGYQQSKHRKETKSSAEDFSGGVDKISKEPR